MDVVALIQQAVEASKKLRELSKKIEDADFRMALADLQSALADAKLESGELKMKLAETQAELFKLKEKMEQKDNSVPQLSAEGVYTFEGEAGCFCTGCWDVHQRKVRVTAQPADFHFAGKWRCPSCKANYGGDM